MKMVISALCTRSDDRGIGDDVRRRTVEEDIVVVGTKLVEHGTKALGDQKLGRVRGNGSHRKQVEVLLKVDDMVRDGIGLSVEVGGDTCSILSKGLGEGRLSKVEVDKDDSTSLQSHGCSKVQQGEGLTSIGIEGGHHDSLGVRGMGHEVQVGTKHPERLVEGVSLAGLHVYLGIGIVEAVRTKSLPVVSSKTHLRNLRQEGNGGLTEVGPSLDGIVQNPEQIEYSIGNTETENESHEKDHHLVRCHRTGSTGRFLDETGIGNGKEALKLVFLPFLEKEDVELLLNLLLTLYGKELELLTGGVGKTGQNLHLLGLDLVGLQLEGGDMVVDGAVECALCHLHVVVQVLHQRVVLGGEVADTVPLHEHLVVLLDSGLDTCGLKSGVGGHQIVLVCGIVNELLYHPCDGKLVRGLEGLHGVLGGLLQICRTGSLHI